MDAAGEVRETSQCASQSPTGQDPAPGPPAGAAAGCAVELTQAEVRGEPWWSAGFEATGSADPRGSALRHAAGLVFAQPPPAGIEFSREKSSSYTEWLLRRTYGAT